MVHILYLHQDLAASSKLDQNGSKGKLLEREREIYCPRIVAVVRVVANIFQFIYCYREPNLLCLCLLRLSRATWLRFRTEGDSLRRGTPCDDGEDWEIDAYYGKLNPTG